jgi:hypothetical protein
MRERVVREEEYRFIKVRAESCFGVGWGVSGFEGGVWVEVVEVGILRISVWVDRGVWEAKFEDV